MGSFGQPSIEARLVRLERKLDLIIGHLGIDISDGLSPRAQCRLANGL